MLMYEAANAKLGFSMQHINPVLLSPAIQRYAWGSVTDFPQLFGMRNPDSEPMAELWYGTHPDGPTQVCDPAGSPAGFDLRSYVQQFPAQMLGDELGKRYGSELPFLLKVLAAGLPLSLQAHPSKEQAEAGFAREQGLGVPVGAPHRSYRDRNHKPELIAALTPFGAMVGFREPGAIQHLLAPLGPEATPLREALKSGGLQGLYDAVSELSTTRLRSIIHAVKDLIAADDAREQEGQEEDSREQDSREQDSPLALCYRTIVSLSSTYPDDPGVLAPLYLNLLQLQPGQALYLPAGILHAYLYGVGVEIMANSNNVLRGGLTSKFIDREELRRVVRFEPYQAPRLSGAARHEYATSFEEFALSRLELSTKELTVARPQPGPEILLCTHGKALFKVVTNEAPGANSGADPHADPHADPNPTVDLELSAGKAIFVPASCTAYLLSGPATVFRACVGALPA